MKNISNNYELSSLNDFVDHASIYRNDIAFGKLLSYYNIAPRLIEKDLIPYSVFSNTRLEWNNHSYSAYYLNNDFTIYIKNPLTGQIILSENVGNLTYFDITYQKLPSIYTTGFHEIVWYVKANQFDSGLTPYDTGFYISESKSTTLQGIAETNVSELFNGCLVNSGMYWFKFTATSAKTYTFFTTGSTDTFGELFIDYVGGQSISGRLAYDNNSGSNNNFSLQRFMTPGQVIYVRITGNSWNSEGNFTIDIV